MVAQAVAEAIAEPAAGAALDVEHVSHAFDIDGAALPVLEDINLIIEPGEFVALLGPSGCGKSTLLRLVAGLEKPGSGTLREDDNRIRGPHPSRVVVFQDPTLFPWRSVWDNVALGLEAQGILKSQRQRVDAALDLVGLTAFRNAYPHQLSGGMAQRVALARALVLKPAVLLLDEPLGALDAKLRKQLQIELKALQQQVGITFIYVTHDQEEALTMADRLVVMNEGSVRQVGSQRDLYERPADRFVAGFVGRSTFLDGSVEAPGRFRTDGGLMLVCAGGQPGRAALSLRPERVEIAANRQAGLDNSLCGTVEFVSYLGALIDIHVRLSPNDRLVVQIANREGGFAPEVGQPVHVGWPASAGLVFNE